MRSNFTYDPTRQGYNTTLWKTLSGTPATGDFIFIDTNVDYDIDVVFEALTVSESVSFTGTTNVSFSDTVTITENISFFLSHRNIDIFDAITVTENIALSIV